MRLKQTATFWLLASVSFCAHAIGNTALPNEHIDLPGQGEAQGSIIPHDIKSKEHFEWLLERAMLPVAVNENPLPEYDYDKLDYALSEGVAVTPGGRLWAVWVAGGDNDKAFLVLSTSDDKGQTWSKPRAVLDPREKGTALGRRSLMANIWTDPQGRLWLFYDQAIGYFDGRGGVWATFCENPDDEQPRWSAPQRIADGHALNKPIVTSKGEWLVPAYMFPRDLIGSAYKEHFKELDPIRGSYVIASTDQGKTWNRRGVAILDSPARTADEITIAERADGSLWMLGRSKRGMWESFSSDDGQTWSTPQPSVIAHTNARHFIGRLDSGRLLMIKHNESIGDPEVTLGNWKEATPNLGGRTRLSAFLSEDDGKTWTDGLLLVPDMASYPDAVQDADGTIYICYDRDRWYKGEIWLARITEADILAGRLQSPQSAVDLLVSRADGLTEEIRAERREKFRKVRERRQQAAAAAAANRKN